MNKFTAKLQKSSPLILTILGVTGVIGTAVTAVRATPKALEHIDEKKKELEKSELTPGEIVQATWKCYVPSALVGAGTVACIVGISALDKRNQAALTSAYALLNESYKNYRQAARKIYGEDADDKIQAEVAKDAQVSSYDWGYQVYNMNMDPNSERMLFYDMASKKYFTTTMAAVLNAQYHANRNLSIEGICPLNEYLSFLGVEGVEKGNDIGWDIEYLVGNSDMCWLDFDNKKTIMEDGLECIIIDTVVPRKLE